MTGSVLILNNGVQKSGSSLVQTIITKMLQPAYPSEAWRNGWANPSIDRDRLKDYIESGEWMAAASTLVKMHTSYSQKLNYVVRPEVRIIVSQRNIPDSVLSMFHHQVRHNGIAPADKDAWLTSHGISFAEHILRYIQSWKNCPGVLFVNYESLMAYPVTEVATIGRFLGVELSGKEAERTARASVVRLRPGEAPREGAHVRTGGKSLAADEMSPETYAILAEMDRKLIR